MQAQRKPDWLKVKLPSGEEYKRVYGTLARLELHTVCQEAKCPNLTECFHAGTATFLILGDICTRNCRYCNVRHGTPLPLDESEPERLLAAVKNLGLNYIVITSVTRDDLPDGGAHVFARCIELLKKELPTCQVEVLIPDFQGKWDVLEQVIAARSDVINHNMEVTESMFSQLRPQGNYATSLELLRRVGERGAVSKSGFMIGVGEKWDDIVNLMRDLREVDCQRLTIGQYLQPTREHWPVDKYYTPAEFDELKKLGYKMGFNFVESGPLVRSSYHAGLAPHAEA
jgi:lipoic acid synthetase